MRRLSIGLAVLASLGLAAPAFAANLATPTATMAAATPKPTPGASVRNSVRIIARGSCTFDLPSLAAVPTPAPTPATTFGAVPTIVKQVCNVPGVRTGDMVLATLDNYDTGTLDYEALRLANCLVRANNQIDCKVAYNGPEALDPGALTISYVVFR